MDSLFSGWIVLGLVLAVPALFATHNRGGVDRPFSSLLFITWLGLTAIGSFFSLVFSLTGSVLSNPLTLFIGVLGLIMFLGARKSD